MDLGVPEGVKNRSLWWAMNAIGRSEIPFGSPGASMAPFRSTLGPLWVPFGTPLGPFGVPLGALWIPLDALWPPFEPWGNILVNLLTFASLLWGSVA